ncbi:MAG: tetratricopeptide repeat protein [Bacteroidales bacterium]|nr:tetratricopeptide repeat protein [Bacteroidales bacterium]
MKMKRMMAALAVSLIASQALIPSEASAQDDDYRYALELYGKGQYTHSRTVFENLPENPVNSGYALLCAIRLKTADYPRLLKEYTQKYNYSGLMPEIRFRHGLNLFDAGQYAEAASMFLAVDESGIAGDDLAELVFKKAFSLYECRRYDAALPELKRVDKMAYSDFAAPARYTAGSIYYEREQFEDAVEWFGKSSSDPRFGEISRYYIMDAKYMLGDYDYVIGNAEDAYAAVPEDRRPHLARIISESYLIKGDASKARFYYEDASAGKEDGRGDYFYAGSLMYATKDYKGAVENYTKMTDRTDSIGQIANYQLGYSYIQTKNKVAAMKAFSDASAVRFDPSIREDAYFNYAKLSFDLNNDSSVFEKYLKEYPDSGRGELIYSYQALAALYNHDYAGAVAAYDKIDNLDADQSGNYMKANYLRANQLIKAGAWRDAIPCLRAASYYADRQSKFSQLCRYWLAESYFRDGQYPQAREIFTSLYNASALDSRQEGRALPYGIAYTYFKEDNYDQAARWFSNYLGSGDKLYRTDASVRKGDCLFMSRKYADAINAYSAAVEADPSSLYPVYQSGIAYGLSGKNSDKIAMLSRARKESATRPFWSESMYELGRAYVAAKDDAAADECYKEIIGASRDTTYIARALIGLGMNARNNTRYDEALGYYKQVVEKMPGSEYSEDALLAIESIYQSKQEPEGYLAYIESVSRLDKSDSDKEKMLFSGAEQVFYSENYDKALNSLSAYMERYPEGADMVKAMYYAAESNRMLGNKEKACDWYRKVLDKGTGKVLEDAALQYATLSYAMDHFGDALEGYLRLASESKDEARIHTAHIGSTLAAYGAKEYESAARYADAVISDRTVTADEKRVAEFLKAKSLLATSHREEAYGIFSKLSSATKSPEGAESAYLMIQDAYDRGDFDDVKKRVFALADSGTGENYWLAKSFIVLGDSYADLEDYRQARATFESVRDGYKSKDAGDDVTDSVNMRLRKLTEMENE